jgi:hypothetical protein
MSAIEFPRITVPDDLRDLPEASPRRDAPVVLRSVSPVSVARIAVVLAVCGWLAMMVALVLLWIGASAFGLVGNVESFLRDVGFAGFRFSGPKLLGAGALGGLVIVTVGTAMTVLATMLFNLVCHAVGGVSITLADEPAPSSR